MDAKADAWMTSDVYGKHFTDDYEIAKRWDAARYVVWDLYHDPVRADVGAERGALTEILSYCDRNPLLVGFAHGAPTRQELQDRLDMIRAIATHAVGATVGTGETSRPETQSS